MSQHADTSSSDNGTAFTAVLQTTELLEIILQYLDISTFFATATVCRRWLALHKQMLNSNVLMRKKLFLVPASLEEILEPTASDREDYNVYLQRGRRCRVSKARLEPSAVMLNPFLHSAVEGYSWSGDLLKEIVAADDVRSKMLLTQPPLAHMVWPTTFGPKERDGTGEHGAHSKGSYLWIKTNGSVHAGSPLKGFAELMGMLEAKVKYYWGCSIYWKASGVRLEGGKITRSQLDDVLDGVPEVNERMWALLESSEYGSHVEDETHADVVL